MKDRLTAVPCVICSKPVHLVECKVNDLGEPVHEDCYAQRLKEESARHKDTPRRQKVPPEQP
jgi:hypothetical protein